MSELATGGAELRKQIAAALADALGTGWSIFPDAPPVNSITRPTILLERTLLQKLPQAPMGVFQSTYTLVVISNQTTTQSREDYLDGLADEVLEALEKAGLQWQTAERAVYNESNPAYNITLLAINRRQTNY